MIRSAITPTTPIKSELVTYSSRSGRRIAAYIDHPAVESGARHFVVMSPKYGESKKNNLQLAYYLAANGFTVLRFDFTCHFGESEGSMLDFTLPEAVNDTLATIDYLKETADPASITLIASSLSALTAFGATSVDRRIDHLVCIVGVVNLVHTLVQVYQEDLIGGYLAGRRYGVLDILGHEVDMDRFFAATIAANMHTLEGTIAALREVQCPVSLLPAANDVWVRLEDVETLAATNPRIKVYPIEGAMHEVRENRAAAEESTRALIGICRKESFGDDSVEWIEPDRKQLFRQNRIERDRLRQARPVSETEDVFWGKYLDKYRVMEKMGDYQAYLNLVGRELGPFEDGEIVLDAGCGNGLFGVWVLRELIQRVPQDFENPPLYVGLDLTDSGLRDAIAKHLDARHILNENTTERRGSPGLLYGQVDLDAFSSEKPFSEEMLRFEENCFDKIACSLLLSYLQDPERLVAHLYNLLRPGGRIMISSMKPFCDLSAIYRDFVEEKAASQDIESARELLRAAGAIKTKQEQGYYAFFSEEELMKMLMQVGFKNCCCYSSLGNQANVASATK